MTATLRSGGHGFPCGAGVDGRGVRVCDERRYYKFSGSPRLVFLPGSSVAMASIAATRGVAQPGSALALGARCRRVQILSPRPTPRNACPPLCDSERASARSWRLQLKTQGGSQMIRSKNTSWLAAGIVALVGSMAGFAQAASRVRMRPPSAHKPQSWVKAYNGGDAKAVAALYAEDALLLPPGAPGVRGRAAILEFFTKDIAGSKAAGAVFAIASQNRCRCLGQHGLGIRHVQGDGEGRRRRDRQVSLGLSQEGWKVALHPRYLECGCALRSSCCTADRAKLPPAAKKLGRDFQRISGPRRRIERESAKVCTRYLGPAAPSGTSSSRNLQAGDDRSAWSDAIPS